MRRSRIGWAVGVIAPWCLGVCLAMSITADAGQDAVIGATLAPLAFRAPEPPSDLVPIRAFDGNFGHLTDAQTGLAQEARLVLGAPDEFKTTSDEIEPRRDMKRNVQTLPQIDRSHRGDPAVGLRPTFDTHLRRPGSLAGFRARDILFRHDETSPSGAFSPSEGDTGGADNSSLEAVETFEPWPDGESPTTAPTRTDASPAQGGSTMTMRPAAINERLMQGATPAVPRAKALASATPAPADATPVEVVALPSTRRPGSNVSVAPQNERPNYAALIDQDQATREKRCLAEAIYFEARSEPEEGQAAVAQVILNRVSSGLYPTTICGVVYQNRHHYHACQFSFACEGRSLRVSETDAWQTAVRIAEEVTDGRTYVSDVGGATHYHANYVRPRWASRLKKMDTIGHHIFYALRPGQT